MRALAVGLLAAAALTSASPRSAAQSAYAPGGLFVHPTAYVPRAHQFNIYAAAFTQDESAQNNDSHYPLAISYTPTDRLMVSALASYHTGGGEANHIHLGAFVKYQLIPETISRPAFALTGTYSGEDHLETAIAGVFSKTFLRGRRPLIALHTGLKWGREPDDEGRQDGFGTFVGAQVPLSHEWDLVGETSTRLKFDRSTASAVGVMYHTRDSKFNLSLGLVNRGWSKRLKPFVGVGLWTGR